MGDISESLIRSAENSHERTKKPVKQDNKLSPKRHEAVLQSNRDLRANNKKLRSFIKELNHCPECKLYLKWPSGQWEGYNTGNQVCRCEKVEKS